MLIGYARVSKSDGSQDTALQRDALLAAGVAPENIHEDRASGKKADRPSLALCMRILRAGDTLLVWRLDRLGRNITHLLELVNELRARGVDLKVLDGSGSVIDTTTSAGQLTFAIFAAIAEFEASLLSERTKAGLKAAAARGRKGGRPPIDPGKLQAAGAALRGGQTPRQVAAVFRIARSTVTKYLHADGRLRREGERLLHRGEEPPRRLAG